MKKSAIKQFLSQNFVSMELLVPTNSCLKIYFLSKYFALVDICGRNKFLVNMIISSPKVYWSKKAADLKKELVHRNFMSEKYLGLK